MSTVTVQSVLNSAQDAVVMTIIMSPAMTKAQVRRGAGSQPYVLRRSKSVSLQSEDKKSMGTQENYVE